MSAPMLAAFKPVCVRLNAIAIVRSGRGCGSRCKLNGHLLHPDIADSRPRTGSGQHCKLYTAVHRMPVNTLAEVSWHTVARNGTVSINSQAYALHLIAFRQIGADILKGPGQAATRSLALSEKVLDSKTFHPVICAREPVCAPWTS